MYDIEQIKQQFAEVIQYSQRIYDPQIDNLFEQWETSKRRFIERFGGLIYEWPEPVEFVLDSKAKRFKAMEFIEKVNYGFNNEQLAEFLDLNIDTFFDNKVSNTCNKQIPEGMKLIKAFKFFETNKKALRDMQDLASQLIQEDKVKGTLCFSVHPLDFLSSSENTYRWRSCHALDGEYRAGNLSYMTDNSTFMVYLKGADNVQLTAFGSNVLWNSKKWRMLIHANEYDDFMFAGRQYPFPSKSGIDLVLNIYNNLMYNSNPWYLDQYGPWQANYVETYTPQDGLGDIIELDESYLLYNHLLFGLRDVVHAGFGALNYNDILNSTCYTHPYYAVLRSGGIYHKSLIENPIVIGHEVLCLHCGKERIANAETMRCDTCELQHGYEENDIYGSCCNCGARIYFDDAPLVGESDYVCDHCYDNYCFICDNCGTTHYNDHRHEITLDNDTTEYWCSHCYNNC